MQQDGIGLGGYADIHPGRHRNRIAIVAGAAVGIDITHRPSTGWRRRGGQGDAGAERIFIVWCVWEDAHKAVATISIMPANCPGAGRRR